MTWQSALYPGVVMHRRYHPARHDLRYRIFSILIDLDEMQSLSSKLRLFSVGRFNLVSFFERDHGDGRAQGLRDWVRDQCAAAGIDASGAIRLLCMPRVLGHAFNPLSVFFCHDAAGALRGILYQVNNTFGQRHSYLIGVENPESRSIRQATRKVFHVSPFMPMDMEYRFRVLPPGKRLSVVIDGMGAVGGATGKVITAGLSGQRVELTDAALLGAVLKSPALGLKVIAGIHWEALKLWRKKVGFYPKPAPPAHTVTIVTG
ncbi:DUF1365 domain-containing protein [Acidisoma silvae]|uniref:DUF1365 domain-containing protein n=1 Tax=Acidisoma silvae TaxID=2802396 RepID=A0A964DZY6_9PROT|nr:DUF1365 domain-containing protein [Acidisoma silvae]MCB8876602.1 DUF1365 domain-containing protein [Acidisoma silvae]